MSRLFCFFLLFVLMSSPVAADPPASTAKVRITEVDDISFGQWNSGDLAGNDSVCIYRDDGRDKYRVGASDNSTVTIMGFYLENPARTVKIPYIVRWNNKPNTSGNDQLTDLADGRSYKGTNSSNQTCGGSLNANFEIIVSSSDLQRVPGGTYSATVKFKVEPD